ncbi:hypothetical protein Pcinc_011244 [Petrolisthes cinctipes]|uniref:Alpha-macroglobulin-like TED domain-containing protein n=1 Tax=Petrolisthes cinctipes TaxID=88211 RepID=A0AAE1G396_PETCI|nr:hypothetical protein Pcinc_011244 [Petrolisthes cinctipes]KAK3884496.1 hypothetical protein Pcinc_011244 [Petrolisthes cinctipes]
MQGGISSGNTVSLTAYVMAALLEARQPSHDQSVSMAARCLTKDNSTHPYVLAIKAYAFALASHPNATSLMQKLLDQAVVTKNAMYWNLPKENCENTPRIFPQHRAQPIEVENTPPSVGQGTLTSCTSSYPPPLS